MVLNHSMFEIVLFYRVYCGDLHCKLMHFPFLKENYSLWILQPNLKYELFKLLAIIRHNDSNIVTAF